MRLASQNWLLDAEVIGEISYLLLRARWGMRRRSVTELTGAHVDGRETSV